MKLQSAFNDQAGLSQPEAGLTPNTYFSLKPKKRSKFYARIIRFFGSRQRIFQRVDAILRQKWQQF